MAEWLFYASWLLTHVLMPSSAVCKDQIQRPNHPVRGELSVALVIIIVFLLLLSSLLKDLVGGNVA